MARLAKLQLIGPLVLFCAVLAAEGAAYALARSPASEFLWYINLEVFGSFQRTHYALSHLLDVDYLQLIGVALPVLSLALVGYLARRQLLLAISSNLSFVYAAFIAYSWRGSMPAPRAASLGIMAVPSRPDFYLFVVLLGASLLSFVISHAIYLAAVRARASSDPRVLGSRGPSAPDLSRT
jgi:hypothetical protein